MRKRSSDLIISNELHILFYLFVFGVIVVPLSNSNVWSFFLYFLFLGFIFFIFILSFSYFSFYKGTLYLLHSV